MDAYFSNIEKQIQSKLLAATQQITIAVAWFTNERLFDSIIQKLKEKIDVSLIVIYDDINCGILGVDFHQFISNGGKLYFSSKNNIMHNKFCIIDNNLLINGSYNWTYYAEYKNKENVMFITDSIMISKFSNEFEDIASKLNLVSSYNKRDKNTLINSAKQSDTNTKNEIISDLFSFAYSEFLNKNYEKSLSLTNDIIAIDNTNYPDAYFLKALNLLKSEDYDNFIIQVNNVIDKKPTFNFNSNIEEFENDKTISLFKYYYNLNEIKKSCLYSNYILKFISPIENELLFDIAYSYYHEKHYNKSSELASKYIDLEPQKISGYHLLGRIYNDKPDLLTSEKYYSKSIEISNQQYADYWNRHLVYNKLSKAIKGFDVTLLHLKEKVGYDSSLINEYTEYVASFIKDERYIKEYQYEWKSILDLLLVIKNCTYKIEAQSDEKPLYSYYIARGHSFDELGFKEEAKIDHTKAQEIIDNLEHEERLRYNNSLGLKINEEILNYKY